MSLLISSSPLSVFFLLQPTSCCSFIRPSFRLGLRFCCFCFLLFLCCYRGFCVCIRRCCFSFGTSCSVCLLLVLLHFLFRSFLTVHSSSSYRSSIGFLSSRFSFPFSWIMLHSPFRLPLFMILPKSSFVQRFDHKRRHHTSSCFLSPFGVMYVACFSAVFLYIVLTAQNSVASPIASSNLLSCFRH